MSITTAQIRGARGLLDWSQAELSRRTGISTTSIGNIESGNTQARESTLSTIRNAFEDGGIAFVDKGVRLRNDIVTVIEKRSADDNVFLRLLDDVYMTMNDKKGEVLFGFSDNSISPQAVVNRQMQIREDGNTMRFLVKNNAEFLRYELNEYRYLPEGAYRNNPYVVYGDKVGIVIEQYEKILLLRDANFTETMRQQFEIIWNFSQKPEKK